MDVWPHWQQLINGRAGCRRTKIGFRVLERERVSCSGGQWWFFRLGQDHLKLTSFRAKLTYSSWRQLIQLCHWPQLFMSNANARQQFQLDEPRDSSFAMALMTLRFRCRLYPACINTINTHTHTSFRSMCCVCVCVIGGLRSSLFSYRTGSSGQVSAACARER